MASVSSQGVRNITASSFCLEYSHADIESWEYNKYSANYGGH